MERTTFEFAGAAMVAGQPMWATAPARLPDGTVDLDGEHVSVLTLTLGRARIVRHHGYEAHDWAPDEGW
jgi:hypothetical protein